MVPLLQVPGVKRGRAIQLVKAGFKSYVEVLYFIFLGPIRAQFLCLYPSFLFTIFFLPRLKAIAKVDPADLTKHVAHMGFHSAVALVAAARDELKRQAEALVQEAELLLDSTHLHST